MSVPNRNSTASQNKAKRYPSRRGRARRSRSGLYLGIALAAIAALALVIFLVNDNSAGAGGPIAGLQTFANLDRSHTSDPVTYAQTPPVGGPHRPAWQNCGVYTSPVPNEHAVHSLEHGVIWITYQPDLDGDALAKLQTLTRQSSYRLLSPYPGLDSPIVASAWGYQLKLDSADDPRLAAFIEKYEQNPFGPEPGASCSGGVGTPG